MNRYGPKTHQPSEKALKSVYVGNIGYDVSEEELANIFSKVGHVVSFRLVHDRETGKSKGFGFCEFLDPATANTCIRAMNQYELRGRSLRLDSAIANERMMPSDDFRPQPPQQQPQQKPMTMLPQPQPGVIPNSGANERNPYGLAPINGNTPEAISKSLSNLTPELMFKVIQEMKHLAQTNMKKCLTMLDTNPQLSFALLQAMVMMHWINTDNAFNLLDKNTGQDKTSERGDVPMMPPREEERSHGPGPTMIPPQQQPPAFRPPQMPSGPSQEHQFFTMDHQNMYRQPFRPQMPPQQAPPRQSMWGTGPPQQQQRFGGPPQQHFGGPPQRNPGPPFPNQAPQQDFGDNFRGGYGSRPGMPPSQGGFSGRPPFRQPLPDQRQAFIGQRPTSPDFNSHQQPHRPPHRGNDMEDEDDMIQQLMRLTDAQIAELNPDEQVKVRQLREQLGVGR